MSEEEKLAMERDEDDRKKAALNVSKAHLTAMMRSTGASAGPEADISGQKIERRSRRVLRSSGEQLPQDNGRNSSHYQKQQPDTFQAPPASNSRFSMPPQKPASHNSVMSQPPIVRSATGSQAAFNRPPPSHQASIVSTQSRREIRTGGF